MQLPAVIVLLGLMVEMVELNEAYKYVRPYKFYNPPPWRPPRWHSSPKAPKHYYSKRIPPTYKYHPYEPQYPRYTPLYEDSVDTSDDDKSYVIVIQLPRRKDKQKPRSSQDFHVARPSSHERDIDYVEDNDDELKVYQLDNKKVRIKLDQLSVLA